MSSVSPAPHGRAHKLGRNNGGYAGERIDPMAVIRAMEALAGKQGWNSEAFLDEPGLRLIALSREVASPLGTVYVSSGIHGDEPAGPVALLRLFEQQEWSERVSFWVCPCLNPTGLALGRRENAAGIDLNRDYLNPKSREISAHTRWLGTVPRFDLSICVHEDWESQGFYLYELCGDQEMSIAPSIIEAVARVCPVDYSEIIEGRPAQRGIIRPDIDPRTRPDWPEAFYLTSHKTRVSYTLEAASDYELPVRVAGLVAALRAIFERVCQGKRT